MTRQFYTDPVAAAWMAKHFEMKFRYWRWNDLSFQFMPVNGVNDAPTDKLCIHPDSLHLLEPQIGDAVEFDRWFWNRKREPEYKDYPYQPHYGRVTPFGGNDQRLGITSSGVCWDDTSLEGKFAIPFKIIQRNGIAFMWPECEEIEGA